MHIVKDLFNYCANSTVLQTVLCIVLLTQLGASLIEPSALMPLLR